MLLEETTDAFRGHGQLPMLLQVGRELFEAQPGMLDVCDQREDRSLRAQRRRWTRRLRRSHPFALLAVDLFCGGKRSKLALDLDSINRSALMQVS